MPSTYSNTQLPGTRAALIADEIRLLIQSGEFPPGGRLRQAEIAARFGVSTTPVREAFTSLAREGWVQQDAHRGVVVFAPQRDDLQENYEIRLALEPLAGGLAAKQLTDQQLDELDELVVLMRNERDVLHYHELNRIFHFRIYTAAGRPRLLQIIETLRDSSDSYLRINASRENKPASAYQRQVHAEHEKIAAALRRRDALAVRRAITEHLKHNRQQLEKTLLRDGE